MAEAVKYSANAAKLHVDFYDRNRVASWVRDHAGLIPWVRSRIGKSVHGWRPYGGWSHAPAGADKTYLLDDKARIKTGSKDEGDGFTAVDGINLMRDALREPGQVVRLVGLSGVGKTRLVEALFDPAIGANALDLSLAIYTDIAEGRTRSRRGLPRTSSPQERGRSLSSTIARRRRISSCPRLRAPRAQRSASAQLNTIFGKTSRKARMFSRWNVFA